MSLRRPCPCREADDSAAPYDECCGRLHRGAAQAATAEELMRSRYAAYALGDPAYVFRTWHPRTRPTDVTHDPGTRWTRLEVLDSGPDWVEFAAHYETAAGAGVLSERSRFEQRAGRWLYVDGDVRE